MKSKLVCALSALAIASTSYAENQKPKITSGELLRQVKEFVSFDAEVNTRLTSIQDGEAVLLTNPSLGVNVQIIKNGCLALKTVTHISDKDNGDWHDSSVNTGVLDGELSDMELATKQIYLHSDCLFDKALSISAGAMSTKESGEMGLDEDGFIDGLKIAYQTDLEALQKIAVTVGTVNPAAAVNVFDRDFDLTEENFREITVVGSFRSLSYQGDLYSYKDQEYARAQANLKLDKVLGFLEGIGVETVFDEDDRISTAISAAFSIGKNKMSAGVRERKMNSEFSGIQDEKIMPGKSIFVRGERQLSRNWYLSGMIQVPHNNKNDTRVDASITYRRGK